MKYLERYCTWVCAVLLLLNLALPASGQSEKAETLVGHWTFEKGVELEDLTGNFADIQLMGATIEDGQLDVDLGKWAIASGDAINSLTEQGNMDVALTIKFRDVSVDLNINESLIVINTLAVKRSVLRGALWSTAGKQVEKPLMATLCALFQVPQKYYDQGNLPDSQRESDFYLFDDTGEGFPCEVKLMGKGNPESADAVYARNSRVLVANILSDLNKQQMDENNIFWIELKNTDDYKRFEQVLNALSIPCKPFTGNLQDGLGDRPPAKAGGFCNS